VQVLKQGRGGEGFADQGQAGGGCRPAGQCSGRVARDEQDWHLRADVPDAGRELRAGHVGHDDVGKHGVDVNRGVADDLQRVLGAGGRYDLVAGSCQDARHHAAYRVVIFYHQDDLAAAVRCSGVGSRRARDVSLCRWQQDGDGGAGARLRPEPDVAAGLLDYAVDGGKAQAGALVWAFGGEERLESVLGDLGGHAGAGVGYGQRDQLAVPGDAGVRVEVSRLDAQPPAARHGGAGVHDQVHDHLLDLGAVDGDRMQVFLDQGQEFDVLADGPPQQLLDAGDDVVEVERLGLGGLQPAEDQELPGEGGGMLGRLGDLQCVVPDRMIAGQRAGDFAGVGHDHREDVVEVVRDPASQAADGIQAVGLTQFPFHAFTFLIGQDLAGDVTQDAFNGDDLAAVVADADRALLGPGDAAVSLPPARDQRGRLRRPPRCLGRAAVLGFHRSEHQGRAEVQLLGLVAGEVGHGGADVLETWLGDQPVAEYDVLDMLR
jgi:hypothetical protein